MEPRGTLFRGGARHCGADDSTGRPLPRRHKRYLVKHWLPGSTGDSRPVSGRSLRVAGTPVHAPKADLIGVLLQELDRAATKIGPMCSISENVGSRQSTAACSALLVACLSSAASALKPAIGSLRSAARSRSILRGG